MPEPCLCGAIDCRRCFPGRPRPCRCQNEYFDVVVEGYCLECAEEWLACVDCEESELRTDFFFNVDKKPRCDRHDELFELFDKPRILLSRWIRERKEGAKS